MQASTLSLFCPILQLVEEMKGGGKGVSGEWVGVGVVLVACFLEDR